MFKIKLKSKFSIVSLQNIALLGDLNMLTIETYNLPMIQSFNTFMNLILMKGIFSVSISTFSKNLKISDLFPLKAIPLKMQKQKKVYCGF